MRLLTLIIFFAAFLNAVEYNGNIEYFYKNLDKYQDENSINFKLKLQEDQDEFTLYSNIIGLSSNKYDYLKANELYLKYYLDDSDILIGKDIKFFGVLEGYNLTDIYNKKNIQYDLFDKDEKLGRYNITFTKEFENSDIQLIGATKDEEYLFKYSTSTDFSDINFLFSHQNSITRYSTYNNLVYANSIFKLEYSYTTTKIKDYYEAGLGVEKEFSNLTGYLEYYKSNNLFLQNQNDIFTAIKYDFKNINDSNIKLGLFKDLDSYNYIRLAEFETRFKESFKVNLQYLKYDNLIKRYYIKLGYYF